jgi:hypothetical protein
MKTIHKTKDNSFNKIFGNKYLFVQFIRDFLNIDILKNIKPDDIEDVSERYLPLNAEGRDSDTVKKIKLPELGGELFVIALVEHESGVNYRMPFKMLRYISLVLDKYEEEVNKEKRVSYQKGFLFPPVLPIVFYDGEANWTAKTNFLETTQLSSAFAKYIPKFEYELVSLKNYKKADIRKFGDVLSLVMLADRFSLGEMVGMPKEYVEQLSSLKLPHSLRLLVAEVSAALMRRLDVPEDEIEEQNSIIYTQGVKKMFEKWGDYSVREVRQQTREESRQYYEPLLAEKDRCVAEKDQRLAALERENAELRKQQQAQT